MSLCMRQMVAMMATTAGGNRGGMTMGRVPPRRLMDDLGLLRWQQTDARCAKPAHAPQFAWLRCLPRKLETAPGP